MTENTRKRFQVTPEEVVLMLDRLKAEIKRRLDQKGWGIFVSSHEVSGILREEMREFEDAVGDNDAEQIGKELLDIAVGAVFGMVSLETGEMDWPKKRPEKSKEEKEAHRRDRVNDLVLRQKRRNMELDKGILDRKRIIGKGR